MEIDLYLLKPLINLFVKAGVLCDLGSTIHYPKKPALGSILKPPPEQQNRPPFRENGGRMGFMARLAG